MIIAVIGPYSHPDDAVKRHRLKTIAEACVRLMERGDVGVSPLVYGLGMIDSSGRDLPDDYDTWDRFCRSLVSVCDAAYVLDIDGHAESKGVADEMMACRDSGVPVYLVRSDTLEVIG